MATERLNESELDEAIGAVGALAERIPCLEKIPNALRELRDHRAAKAKLKTLVRDWRCKFEELRHGTYAGNIEKQIAKSRAAGLAECASALEHAAGIDLNDK
jgi:hypothetical protein